MTMTSAGVKHETLDHPNLAKPVAIQTPQPLSDAARDFGVRAGIAIPFFATLFDRILKLEARVRELEAKN